MGARAEGTRRSRIGAADKRRVVLSQYAAGASIERIAEVNDFTPGSVRAIVARAAQTYRDDTTKSVENVRAMQVQRLDALLVNVWAKATANPPDLAAVREVLRIEALRAKLVGTERAPEGTAAGGDVHFHLADAARVAELHQSFAASAPGDVDGTARDVTPLVLPSGE